MDRKERKEGRFQCEEGKKEQGRLGERRRYVYTCRTRMRRKMGVRLQELG